MKKPKYITTHAELLKLHGRSITCKIEGVYIDDAKIYVDENLIYICQNKEGISRNMFGFKHSWCFSTGTSKYEDHNGNVTEIKLKEEHLTIGQAIDYMLENENNVIEYYDTLVEAKYRERIIDEVREFSVVDDWMEDKYYKDNFCIKYWTKIRKHIEPKQKTIKDLIQAKETFEYKDHWYRFNKDGAIIGSKGEAIGIELIKEILKEGRDENN